MFWILQKNLYAEEGFKHLVEQLDRQGSQYQIVNMIPFAHEIDPDVNPTGNVFVLGATALGKVARKKGWYPGYIDANISYRKLIDNYDKNVLNFDAYILQIKTFLEELSFIPWDPVFVRPDNDGKSFAGEVMSIKQLKEWLVKVRNLEGENSFTSITVDDDIVVAPLQDINAEYRFFVVNGKVITGSRYKLGSRVSYSSMVEPQVYDFAQKMVNIWSPNQAFAIDIALTPSGFKVIEINSINSAGFYHCDMGKFIHAIENMT